MMQGVLGSDVLWLVLLMSVGSHAWSSGWMNSVPPGGDEVKALRHLLANTGPSGPGTRLPAGLIDPDDSSEEYSPLPPHSSPLADYYSQLQGQKRAPGNPYMFGLGKRSRTYKFGLGKRLEDNWKNSPALPAYRQERRSNMYSFGLGKRGDSFPAEDYEERTTSVDGGNGQEKKSRQFSFGLGKREVKSGSSSS